MAMMAIPLILTAVSTVVSYQAQKAQGKHAQQVAYANARVEERKGEQEFAARARESARVARENKRVESSAIARASGLGMSESFINYMADSAATGRYNTESMIYEGKAMQQARGHNADLMRWQGDAKRKQAKTAANMTLLKGAASMASMYGGGAPMGGGGGGGVGDASSLAGGVGGSYSGSAWQNSPF